MKDLPDIRTSISKPGLFGAFKIQLKKDFENCGINSDFSDELIADFDFILQLLSTEVNHIIKTSNDKLTELLYRIDISELQIKKLGSKNPATPFNQIIAELIIKRELQKVVIKQMFRDNP
jgi:hypothetical protein